ncbi:MAG TPA: NAD-dependent epimerase/dehydratase family protein [Gemmatimonadaceae bacterium]|nr:NAD-dependent epimerase/dehydratase family protein [Gemmatimonadaceae bacterium]
MKAFVTGAASPLGRALIHLLRKRGDVVMGQVRRRSGVEIVRKLGAHPVVTDLTRPRVLADAMADCTVVYHLAHYFDFWAPETRVFDAVNVDGTTNTLAAAVVAHVKRVVFCSSAATIGELPGHWGHENTQHRGYTFTEYERSMVAAERMATEIRAAGIEVVVVNPGIIIAPGDPGWTGRMLSDTISGRRRFATTAPIGWVSVHDAALGLVRAAERGQDGARYIVSGETLSPRQLLSYVAKLVGRPRPYAVPRPAILGSAAISSALAATVNRRPGLSLDEARFATQGFRVDGTQVCLALGMEYTPITRWLPPMVESYKTAMTRFDE